MDVRPIRGLPDCGAMSRRSRRAVLHTFCLIRRTHGRRYAIDYVVDLCRHADSGNESALGFLYAASLAANPA